MEKMDVSNDQRVSLAAFNEAQRSARFQEPRRYTYLLAVRPDQGDGTKTAERIFRFTTDTRLS